ncbi:hypothetical protein IEQ34_019101 [Dendrobium chrysotoxum]|uniref:Uncharacterized protein n=1 Tax=Dendrobium chrysotoxum TaxID=161865 RepID=A0AAV7G8H3_DENCH|nr:hypothetical protein IEQ34_019101 [Dendrobium chrysotoxum]
MDVPDIMLNCVLRASFGMPVGPTEPDQPASMFTPGPIMSGFRISGVTGFGPRELNAATTGEGRTPSTVPPKRRTAFGF